MSQSVQLSRREQDVVVLEIYALAQRHAKEWIRASNRDDIVHDLILDCLAQLRERTWSPPQCGLDRFVELRIIDRRIKRRRTRCSDELRDARYLGDITGAPRAWMAQELSMEEDRLREFATAVRKTLPKGLVRAHLMARDDDLTYAQVGKRLRLPAGEVHERVKRVHQAFRDALPGIGIEPPGSSPDGRRIEKTNAGNRSSMAANRIQRGGHGIRTAGSSARCADHVSHHADRKTTGDERTTSGVACDEPAVLVTLPRTPPTLRSESDAGTCRSLRRHAPSTAL